MYAAGAREPFGLSLSHVFASNAFIIERPVSSLRGMAGASPQRGWLSWPPPARSPRGPGRGVPAPRGEACSGSDLRSRGIPDDRFVAAMSRHASPILAGRVRHVDGAPRSARPHPKLDPPARTGGQMLDRPIVLSGIDRNSSASQLYSLLPITHPFKCRVHIAGCNGAALVPDGRKIIRIAALEFIQELTHGTLSALGLVELYREFHTYATSISMSTTRRQSWPWPSCLASLDNVRGAGTVCREAPLCRKTWRKHGAKIHNSFVFRRLRLWCLTRIPFRTRFAGVCCNICMGRGYGQSLPASRKLNWPVRLKMM